MSYGVSVVTRKGERFDIHLDPATVDAFTAESARIWIGDAFEAAGLSNPNPVGKVLLRDHILLLADEQRDAAWAAPDSALKTFLAAALVALARPSLSIDLQNHAL